MKIEELGFIMWYSENITPDISRITFTLLEEQEERTRFFVRNFSGLKAVVAESAIYCFIQLSQKHVVFWEQIPGRI